MPCEPLSISRLQHEISCMTNLFLFLRMLSFVFKNVRKMNYRMFKYIKKTTYDLKETQNKGHIRGEIIFHFLSDSFGGTYRLMCTSKATPVSRSRGWCSMRTIVSMKVTLIRRRTANTDEMRDMQRSVSTEYS